MQDDFDFNQYSEEKLKVVEAIAFDILDYVREADFNSDEKKILDFSLSTNTSVFDHSLIEEVVYELDENWMTHLAGRPISKIFTNLTAISL